MNNKSSTKDLSLSSNERLSINNKSIFAPKKYDNCKPKGFKIYTFHAGFKKKFNDLLVIVFDETAVSVNIYSRSSTPSAPIIWDKRYNKGKVKSLIVNSGNANAHTGKKGIEIIDHYVNFLSEIVGCKKSEILVSSTGVIGEFFDPKLITKAISKINNQKPVKLIDAAKAIMTTDTYPKVIIKNIKINQTYLKIYGIAKGSGMIHPNMATMLVYIFIDAIVPKRILKKLVKNNLENTFNSISNDSDTSTSDTLFLFSLKKTKIDFNIKKNFTILNNGLFAVMKDLALKVVKDGEGLSKLLIVHVNKSRSQKQAKKIAFSIINSPLVKTAVSGEDANWGRVIAAIGKSQEKINQNKIELYFGKHLICRNGMAYNKLNLLKVNNYMKSNTIEISVNLNIGKEKFTAYGNDLTHEYIRINSEYRS